MARKYNQHEVHPITYLFVGFLLLLTLAGISPLFNQSSRDLRSRAADTHCPYVDLDECRARCPGRACTNTGCSAGRYKCGIVATLTPTLSYCENPAFGCRVVTSRRATCNAVGGGDDRVCHGTYYDTVCTNSRSCNLNDGLGCQRWVSNDLCDDGIVCTTGWECTKLGYSVCVQNREFPNQNYCK